MEDRSRGNRFKDIMGRWRTRSLFYPFVDYKVTDYTPLYSLRDEDEDVSLPSGNYTFPSFKRLYLDLNDPTDYLAATTLMGGWSHWEAMCLAPWFQELMDPIRYELEIKIRAEALKAIREEAAAGNKGRLIAARYLADGDYKPKKNGRPNKSEAEAERKKLEVIRKRLAGDSERIGLVLIDTDSTKAV